MANTSNPIPQEQQTHLGFALIAAILCLHAFLWIAVPASLEGSIRLDVAEGVINGPEWQLSYERHPPFSSWLTGLVWNLGSLRYAGIYALGQILALGALLIALQFTKQKMIAISPVALLLCFLISPFATYLPLQVNHNFGLIPFWALVILCAWQALNSNSMKTWIILGLSIGLGLWAKYAILLLVLPIILLALTKTEWRARLLSVQCVVAIATSILLISPHIFDVIEKGASTISFALRTEEVPVLARVRFALEFILNASLYNFVMAVVVTALIGIKTARSALRAFFANLPSSHVDQFLLVIVVGPILMVLLATGFGVRPRLLWLTPFAISFCIFWGRIVHLSGTEIPSRAVVKLYMLGTAFMMTAYVLVRLLSPLNASQLSYPEMDGPALANLAQDYWQKHMQGPIPYLVSFDEQRGRQAIGSLAFDLPYRVSTLEDNDEIHSPWIDMDDLRRRGALVVGPRGIPADAKIGGLPVEYVESFSRPVVRNAKAKHQITFGIIRPSEQPK